MDEVPWPKAFSHASYYDSASAQLSAFGGVDSTMNYANADTVTSLNLSDVDQLFAYKYMLPIELGENTDLPEYVRLLYILYYIILYRYLHLLQNFLEMKGLTG